MPGPIQNIVKRSLNPFIAAGAVLMLCSAIWMISAGHWYALWPAALAFILSAVLFPLLMIPAGFCAGVMMVTEKAYPVASRVFAVLSFVWFVTLLSGYTSLSFAIARSYILTDAAVAVPAVIWALAAAVTPWAFFATRDRDSVFFTGLVYMTALVGAFLFPLALAYTLTMAQVFWFYWLALGTLVGLQALYEQFLLKPAEETAAPAETPAPTENSADTAHSPADSDKSA